MPSVTSSSLPRKEFTIRPADNMCDVIVTAEERGYDQVS